MLPDLQEPLASVEPLQQGPVEHGGRPVGELREFLLHVGGAAQGGVMHEEGHAVQAVGGWGCGVTAHPGPSPAPPHPLTPAHLGTQACSAPLWASGSPSAQGSQWAVGESLGSL